MLYIKIWKIDFVDIFYLKFIKKFNSLNLNHDQWNVYFLLSEISLYNIQAETVTDLLISKIFYFNSSIDRHIKTVTQENNKGLQ
jgi:hypothetical protein